MLKQLRIWNLVLIEFAEIPFHQGLNVLSGETGAGKSAIMNALSLVTGERADASMLRRGAEKGAVEALFDIDNLPAIKDSLNESDILWEKGGDLCIRREISASGRSRAFLNDQVVPLSLLREISAALFDIVGQHANQQLLNEDQHRRIIDLFGGLQTETEKFASSWAEENSHRAQIQSYERSEAQRLRDVETCRREIEELDAAQIKHDEEEELFAEYSRLSHAQELISKIHEIQQSLSGDKHPIIPNLNRHKHTLEQLARMDPTLTNSFKELESVIVELQEISHTLRQCQNHLEHNPMRFEKVEERLTIIDRMKRRYGSSVQEVQAYHQQARAKLLQLEQVDANMDIMRENLKLLEDKNHLICINLTEMRSEMGRRLEAAIVQELQSLNMPKVEFQCRLTAQPRTVTGDDQIEFFLRPNVGEHQVSVKECASGGELSRLMLALQVLLAGKKRIPTLIFDEIDANIGGATATVVGEKLKKIGKQHQVLCITHFPQVAKQAEHHLCIAKEEKEGRTVTQVTLLDQKSRVRELKRMEGG